MRLSQGSSDGFASLIVTHVIASVVTLLVTGLPDAGVPAEPSRERTVEVNGIRLHYRESGSGPAMLPAHGIVSTGEQWDALVPRFAPDDRVIVVELPAHGRSITHEGPYLADNSRRLELHREDSVADQGAHPACLGRCGGRP